MTGSGAPAAVEIYRPVLYRLYVLGNIGLVSIRQGRPVRDGHVENSLRNRLKVIAARLWQFDCSGIA